jgi:tetratricopeptide (TPR) repeat protein
MKKIIVLISVAAAALFAASSLSAQGKYGPDSTECIKYLSYYTEYYKQKNYDSALPNWRNAYKYCPPTSRYSLLSDGTTLLRRLITQNAKNPVYKDQLVDSLMTLYKQRVEFWPKYATASLNNQALDMYNYMKDEPKKLFEGLTEVVTINKTNTKPNIFLFQLSTACDLYKDGLLDPEQVINTYENAVAVLSSITPKNEVEGRMINQTIADIESLFIASQVASCENLIALFEPRFAAAPEDLDLAKNIVKMMTVTEGCTDNNLFLNAVTVMYNQEPSHTSAYYLYKLYAGRNDVDNAAKYMKEAVTFEESDGEADAGYFYELATFFVKNGKTADAYKAATAAVELSDTYDAKCYYLMGTIWGSTVCGGDEIAKRAPYWVAVDYMQKAKNADPALAEDADRMISQYRAYFPQTAEAFMYNITDGESYTVACNGMRAVTTVRTQK